MRKGYKTYNPPLSPNDPAVKMVWFFRKSQPTTCAPWTRKKMKRNTPQTNSSLATPYRHVPTHATLGMLPKTSLDFEKRIREANRKRIEGSEGNEESDFGCCTSKRLWEVKWPLDSDDKLGNESGLVVSGEAQSKDDDGRDLFVVEDAADDEITEGDIAEKCSVDGSTMWLVNEAASMDKMDIDRSGPAGKCSGYHKLHDEGMSDAHDHPPETAVWPATILSRK